ncbi:hypothetical protein BC826DRAFT_74601 [Russula brevipes]|nr:hypothetical protein BC826DRAFT_74601 [Russula brevipes]
MKVNQPPAPILSGQSIMSNRSPSADTSAGHQPAGAPGNRTPRRVQWVDENETAGRTRDCGLEEDVVSTHELDEAGLDPAAFHTLTHALERHRSSSALSLPPTSASSQPSRPSSSCMTTSAESSVPASPRLSAPLINVPGEAFIEPHERAGLPPRRPEHKMESRLSDSEVRAAHVVRAHSRNPFSRRFYRRRSRSAQPWTKERADQDEETVDTAHPVTRTNGGILSALLTLYDRESDRVSISDTMTTSSVETPERRPPGSPTHPLLDLAAVSGRRLATASKALHLPELRPRRERNAAGVWGSLITSTTGTLVGATAPTHSTIAPDVERPGYHLSRYSLDGNIPNAPTNLSSQRPRSMLFQTTDQNHSSSSSTSQTPAHANPHVGSSASVPPTPRARWIESLHDLPKRGWTGHTSTAPAAGKNAAIDDEGFDEKGHHSTDTDNDPRRDASTWRREKKKRRRKAEIYITRHISSLISRQTFVLKLARAMMMFGGPTHRLQAQIQSTAQVLEISLSCLYLPDVMLIAFDDDITSTSSVKLIRQSSALDLGKLQDAHKIYWRVIHDDISVTDASSALDGLMLSKPLYSPLQLIFFGGMASASICSVSFNGSLIDSLVSFPLGALLVAVQIVSVRNELYSNVFEITIATLLSFLSGALAQTHKFCYSAVASSSVVLILPGFIVLCGSLELSSRNIVAGAVRLCYALVYSLLLGFGLAIGAETYEKLTGLSIFGPEDYLCARSHGNAPWFRKTPSHFWAFLTVPTFSLFLSLRNQAPWYRKELAILVAISCLGWVTNHFVSIKFPNQSDISAAVGYVYRSFIFTPYTYNVCWYSAFAVGVTANIYGRLFRGNAFAVMITGVLFQLPSGLGNGGLLHFASQQASGSSASYLSGFQVALQLISVSVGLTVGLGISLVLVFPIQSRKRKSGVFSL